MTLNDENKSREELIREMAGLRQRLAAAEDAAQKRLEKYLYENQTHLQALVDNVQEAILIIDNQARFVDANPAACALLGYSREEMLTLSLFDVSAASREATKRLWETFIAAGKQSGEYTLRRKDGDLVLGEAHSTANFLPGLHLKVIRDITARKRLEEQLIQTQKMDAISRLAGEVAHDFNNILTGIMGYTDFLLEDLGEESPYYQDALNIQQTAEQATALTHQLLAFSRRQILLPQKVNLNDTVIELTRTIRGLLGPNIDLDRALWPDLKPVKVDPEQMEQVILSLVTNAREAMPNEGLLTIKTDIVALSGTVGEPPIPVEPGRYVALSVGDTGVGIDEEIRPHIFEPFFTTKKTNVGLGLSVVYGIIKQSKGYVTVRSEPGKGSTFTIYLPVMPASELEEDKPDDKSSIQPAPAPARGSEIVLLVEDSDAVRGMASRTLSDNGYNVLEAGFGEEAIYLAQQHDGPIHLLLTDIVMPGGMSGRELAGQLLATHPETRVLYMSGYSQDMVLHHGIQESQVRFLAKPFTAAVLLNKVREVLDA